MNKVNNKIEEFLTSDYIYLPYEKEYQIFFKDKDYVYKNDLIATDGINNVYSYVSGILLGIATLNNKKYLVIENDLKERTRNRISNKKDINNYTKEEIISLLKKYNVLKDEDLKNKVLIVNGISEYIDEITYSTLLKNYTTKILDTIDTLIDKLNMKKCFLSISANDQECVNILFNNLGTYPKIDMKLFNYDYSIGNKYILIDRLTNYKNKNYGVLFLNIIDILNIYNILKKDLVPNQHFITLGGNLLKKNKVIKIVKGTNLDDLLREFNIKEKTIFVNGLLNGKKIDNTNFIIDNNLRSIFVNSENVYIEQECINCGLCVNSCPVGLNPKYMYFNNNRKSQNYKTKCINCGICEFICPSKINLRSGNNDKK